MRAKLLRLLLSACLIVWTNALPYLSRLPRGAAWAAEYWPDEGVVVFGLVFILAMFSMPAIPLIWGLRQPGQPGRVWILAWLVVTVLTWLLHMDLDLAADAQAATALVIFPLLTMGAAYGVLALNGAMRHSIGKWLRGKFMVEAKQRRFGLLDQVPGFSALPEQIKWLFATALVVLMLWLLGSLVQP